MREPDWYTARRLATAEPLPPESIDLTSADGRTLATAVVAGCDLPSFDNSAMDGWAVRGSGPWQVMGEVLAGQGPDLVLQDGQAARVATGSAVPVGTTAVLRTENAVSTSPLIGDASAKDIRPAGEECRTGETLAHPGAVLGPALIGLLCASGLDTVEVRREPAVAVVLFGDELVDSGVAEIGQVRDALGPQLPGWIRRMGARVESVSRAQDTLQEHVDRIRQAASRADLVMTTGGTAAGPVDHLHAAVADLGGEFVVDSVAVRPGHPMALARLADSWLLGLPGNPQSAIVALLSLGQPLIDSMLGRPPGDLPFVTLGEDTRAPDVEHRLVASRLIDGVATPVRHLGSAMLRGLASADGFAVIDPGGCPAGTAVRWLGLP